MCWVNFPPFQPCRCLIFHFLLDTNHYLGITQASCVNCVPFAISRIISITKKKKNLWIKYVRSGGIIWNTVTCTLLIPNKTFSGIADVHAVQEGRNEWTAQQKGEKKDDCLLVIYVRLWDESHQETSRRLMTKLRAYCEVITVFFTVGSERYIRCSSGLSSRASDSLYKSSKQHHLQYYCTGETLF